MAISTYRVFGPYVYNVEILRILDGDTFECEVDLGFSTFKKTKVRLLGVDTPETYRPSNEAEKYHGEQATEFAKNWFDGYEILLRSEKAGSFRWLGHFYRVMPDGKYESLTDALIKAGFEKRDSY